MENRMPNNQNVAMKTALDDIATSLIESAGIRINHSIKEELSNAITPRLIAKLIIIFASLILASNATFQIFSFSFKLALSKIDVSERLDLYSAGLVLLLALGGLVLTLKNPLQRSIAAKSNEIQRN
ncbi:MAG: hypothetical protein NT027_02630 [Proteobacteria bacterium]|nr:hypothetical protein [Pseudomonadota bacterium]